MVSFPRYTGGPAASYCLKGVLIKQVAMILRLLGRPQLVKEMILKHLHSKQGAVAGSRKAMMKMPMGPAPQMRLVLYVARLPPS